MISKDYAKLDNHKLTPFKVFGSITTPAAATNADYYYYVKPSVRCRLVNAVLHIVTGPGTDVTLLFTKKTAMIDPDLPYDTVTASTNVADGTAVASTDLIQIATGTANTININCIPGANYSSSANVFDPSTNDAVYIKVPDTNSDTLLVGELELEFMPV